ncbi:TCR/Tet family MFS transporter [Balneola sp. MJW-20]|uniref:TCR/Tet family MFS transporter n=1 Tax=Gracilimonas aurantiaca TaxID=3234185 RepID=UPI003466D3DF
MTKNSKAALTFIFITVLVDVIGLGIIIPVMPDLIMELIGQGLSTASLYAGWITFTYAATQFIFAPVIGALSDQYGRRPVLLFSLLGFGIGYILIGLAPGIIWLFAARFISGITGASFTTASAYIADISTPVEKAKNFGLIGAAFGLGFIIGPVVGGLLGEFGSRIPFYGAAALTLANALFGFFVLPESLNTENRRLFNWKRANPLGSLKQISRYPTVRGLIIVFFFLYVSSHAPQSTWTYYTMLKFEWDVLTVGLSLGAVGLLVAIVQGGLTRVVIPRIGENRTVYMGLSFYFLGFLALAFAPNSFSMFIAIIPYSLGGFAGPALQGIISNEVPDNEQGELQGGLTSLISLSAIFGPPIMTNLFGFFTSEISPVQFPGAPFMLGAVLILGAVIWTTRTLSFSDTGTVSSD